MASSLKVVSQRPTRTSILVVDDKPQRLLTYDAILESLDLNVVQAPSGQSAIKKLDEEEFAAVLLDINMPGLNGFETAAAIRRHPHGGQTPIIFVTGVHVSDLDRMRGYEMGAADYVSVPVVPEILRAKVKVLVQLHEQRQEVSWLAERLLQTNEDLARAHKQLKAENLRQLRQLNESLANTNQQLELEIRERLGAERRLKEAARRKDDFITILAHELRNPLSAIQSAIELMLVPSLAQDRLVWSRELIQRQVGNLTRLIDELLDVSRVTNGRVLLKRKVIDLREVLRRAVDATFPQAEKRRHSMTLEAPDEPLPVYGDDVRLEQVFGNLLANATRYMEDGGHITVRTARDAGIPGRVTVHVIDVGAGLPPDMLEHIFEPFAQLRPEGSRKYSGLGIGLAIVRNLVELHGGRVRAESEGPNRGSQFIVDLPLTESLPATPTFEQPGAAPVPLRVLVIDDNVDAAEALAQLLERTSSHEVRLRHDGTSGVEAAIELRPDVILLDIGLPDIDGYEVARRIRSHAGLCGVQIVAISGFSAEGAVREEGFSGFNRYLTKPVSHADLEKVLADLETPQASLFGR